MRTLAAVLEERLEELEGQGLRRELRIPTGLDFSSNDYLGLGRHPGLAAGIERRLQAAKAGGEPLSTPASRLLAGNTRRHEELEARLATFKGFERALLFPSGYQANIGLMTALIGPRDRALSDAQNHASLIDGLRLSGCSRVIFPHLDVGVVEEALARPHPGGRTFLVTESLFSMDGDIAPLDLYGDLADRYGAELIVDEAHATGVFGDVRGSGLVERFGLEGRVTAVVSTFGKALGLAGAWVAGSGVVIDYLVSRCRSFLFSTAMPPLWLFSMAASLDLLAAEPWRRRQVLALADLLRRRLRAGGLEGCRGEGPIVPVILGEVARTVEMAEVLQGRGFDVRAIRPPTVPPGTSRLRISVHADHREEDLEVLAEEILAQLQGACRVGTSGAVP